VRESSRGRKRRVPEPEAEPQKKPPVEGAADYDSIVGWFMAGNRVTVSDEQPFAEYFGELRQVPKLEELGRTYFAPDSDEELAFAMELVLEALHQALRLTREDLDSTITFTELMKFNILRSIN
jgi:hypothetical protein